MKQNRFETFRNNKMRRYFMGRLPTITREEVFTLCGELDASRQSPSVRAIQSKLGGSTVIIAEHLRKWRQEKQEASFKIELPSSIAKAIVEYVEKVSRVSMDQLRSDIESREKDINELSESIQKLEDALVSIKGDRLLLSRQVEALEAENKLLREQVKSADGKITDLQKEVLEAEKKASHAEGMLKGLEKKRDKTVTKSLKKSSL
jgi:chromosome segregation ATPase